MVMLCLGRIGLTVHLALLLRPVEGIIAYLDQ